MSSSIALLKRRSVARSLAPKFFLKIKFFANASYAQCLFIKCSFRSYACKKQKGKD